MKIKEQKKQLPISYFLDKNAKKIRKAMDIMDEWEKVFEVLFSVRLNDTKELKKN